MERRSYRGQPIAIMMGMVQRKFLFFRWEDERWETFDESQALAVFKKKFLSFPHKMVVVEPDFSRFNPKFNQAYLFITRKHGMEEYERELFQRCLDKIKPENAAEGEAAEVAFVKGDSIKEPKMGIGIVWAKPIEDIVAQAEIISKKTGLKRIEAPLKEYIGREEGGIYAPYEEEGLFHLMSL